MEFFIKMKPEFIEVFRIGMRLNLLIDEQLVWVTITKIEEEKVFFEAIGDDEKYLKDLYDEVSSTFNIQHT